MVTIFTLIRFVSYIIVLNFQFLIIIADKISNSKLKSLYYSMQILGGNSSSYVCSSPACCNIILLESFTVLL